MGRHELTDQQWQFLAPLLPNNGYKGGQWKDHRTVLNGILWRLRTGALWRDLPARYGPWQTVYHRFNRYRQDGTLDQLLQALQRRLDAAGLIAWDLWCVDGSAIRASRAAAGAGQKGDLMSRPIMPWAAPVAGSPARSTS